MILEKIHRIDLEGFRVSQALIDEKGEESTLRKFIIGVTQVEIPGPGTKVFYRCNLVHKPDNRLHISTGDWILKDSSGTYYVIKHEEFQKKYSLIKTEKK